MKKKLEMFNRSSRAKRRDRAEASKLRGYRASFDVLERRALLATVDWIAASGGDWNLGSNWSTGQVPGPNDTAVIDLSGSPTISIGTQGADVGSIQSTDPISINQGALTVASNSSISGGLSMNGGSLTATGAGVAFNVTGTTTVSGGSLFAEAGAELSLPDLKSYNPTAPPDSISLPFLQANGAGSVLNLPSLTDFQSNPGQFDVDAENGGIVDLTDISSISTYASLQITSNGSNSLINFSALRSINGLIGNSLLPITISQGASVFAPDLSSAQYVNMGIDNGTLDASALTTFSNGQIHVGSGDYIIQSLTNIDGTSVYLTGSASLTLPGVTNYVPSVINYYSYFQTSDSGSLSLPNLASILVSSGRIEIALYGGDILLPALGSITGGSGYTGNIVNIDAETAGDLIDLSALTVLRGGSLTVSNGAEVLDPNLTTLVGVNVDLGPGNISTSQWTSLTDGSLNVSVGTYTLSGLTNINGSSLLASNAILTLPNVSSYSNSDGMVYETNFQSMGSGSVLSLPNLSRFGIMNFALTIQAVQGGVTSLPALTSIQSSAKNVQIVRIEAEDPGDVINLSSLTTFAGGTSSFYLQAHLQASVLIVTNGGSVVAPKLTTLSGIIVTLDGTGSINTGQWINLTQSDLQIEGGSYSLGSLSNIDGSSVTVSSGASLSLPSVASYSQPQGDQTTLEATGTGSVLNLSGLTGFGVLEGNLQVLASIGGRILMQALTTIQIPQGSRYGIEFDSIGSNSLIDLSSLSSFSGGGQSSLYAENQKTVLINKYLTSLQGVNLYVDLTTSFPLNQLTSLTNGRLTIGSGSFTLPNLSDINGSSINVYSGATLTLPNVVTYTNLDVSNDSGFTANGSNSILNLPSLSQFSLGSQQYRFFIGAVDGGHTNLPALPSILNLNQNYHVSISFYSDGLNSVVDLSSLRDLSGTNSLDEIQFTNGGVVIDPNLTTLLNVDIITDPTNALTIPADQSVTYSLAGAQITAGSVDDLGSLGVVEGGSLSINGNLAVDSAGALAIAPGGTLNISGNLVGSTQNPTAFTPQGTVVFDGPNGSGSNQLLEAMSADLGPVISGFINNFAYGTLSLANDASVVVVDQSINTATGRSEAVYANELIVPAKSTLNLNGLHMYVRGDQIAGTVVGGTVTVVPTTNPITLGTPSFGTIALAGAIDDWTFSGTAGESIAAALNPGPGAPIPAFPPRLDYGQIELLGPNGNVLAIASSATAGAIALFNGVHLPSNGTYTIEVQAPVNQPSITGNYVLSVYNVTPSLANLTVNTISSGTIANPYAVNQWLFAGTAGERVQLQVLYTSTSDVSFNLNGPDGYLAFANLQYSSSVITLPVNGIYVLTIHGDGIEGGSYAFNLGASPPAAPPVSGIAPNESAGSRARTSRFSALEQRYEARIERIDAYRQYLATLRQERLDRRERFHQFEANRLNGAAHGGRRSPNVFTNGRLESANTNVFGDSPSGFTTPRFGLDHPVFFGENSNAANNHGRRS